MTGPFGGRKPMTVDPATDLLTTFQAGKVAVSLGKGTANGIAALDASGNVLNAAGVPVTGGTVTADTLTGAGATGKSVIKATDPAAGRTALGLGTAATAASSAFATAASVVTAQGAADAAAAAATAAATTANTAEQVFEYTSTASPTRTGTKTGLWKSTKFPGAAAPINPVVGDTWIKHPNDYA